MKKVKFTLAVLVIVIVGIFLYWRSGIIYTSTATSGIVLAKYEEDRIIDIGILEENGIETVKVYVEDVNTWHLIEVKRSYFISYESTNGSINELLQIKIDDGFGKIYKDRYADILTDLN